MNNQRLAISVTWLALVLLFNGTLQPVQAQSPDDRAAGLIERVNDLPADTKWHVKAELLLKIAMAYEESINWTEAKRSIKYRRGISQLFEEHADFSVTQVGYEKNRFMLRFLKTLEEKSVQDAMEIWKHVKQQRSEFPRLIAQREYQKALRISKQLKVFFGEHLGENNYWTAIAAANEVVALIYLGQCPAESETILKNAIKISSRDRCQYSFEIIALNHTLIATFNYQERYSDSLDICNKCLPVLLALYGPKDPRTLEMQLSKANSLRRTGKTNEARKILANVVKIARAPNGPRHLKTLVEADLALIELEIEARNFARAIPWCEALYAGRERFSKQNCEWLARTLMNRVELLIAVGDRAKLDETAIELSEVLPQLKTGWIRHRSKFELGRAYIQLGQLEKAKRLLHELQNASGNMVSGNAIESNLARIERMQGNFAEAERRFRFLIEINRDRSKRDYDSLQLWQELGLTYRRMEDRENELKCFEKCFELELREQQTKNKHLNRVEKLEVTWRLYAYYFAVLQTMLSQPGEFDTKDAFRKLLIAHAECENAPSITVDRYLENIPKGSAIVQFILRHTRQPIPEKDQEFTICARYSAFVIKRGKDDEAATVSWVELGEAADVGVRLQKWSRAIAQCLPSDTNRGIRSLKKKRQAADIAGIEFQKMLRPIFQPLLNGVERIVVCPAGDLWQVPWNALQPEPKGPYLIQASQVNVETNCGFALSNLLTRDLLKSMRGKVDIKSHLELNNLVDLGLRPQNPKMTLVYDVDFGPPTQGFAVFDPLPATKQEAESVLSDWGDLEVDPFSQQDALENKIIKSLKTSNVAYFATHVYSYFANSRSLDPNNRSLEVELQRFNREYDAFRSQSIVLSAANQPKPVGRGFDNYLLASEILSLDLRNLNLVVLSTCSSASGARVDGIGNCGVQRAFRLAGSKTVIGSLWPVEDKSTMQLMSDFSRLHFKEGRPASESLRQAILKQVESKPFHLWAGWTVLGQ